jgi:hypothetical protein
VWLREFRGDWVRPSGTWEFIVKRKGVLPKPISITFDTEAEGDEYVRRLEAQLDRGIVPAEFSGINPVIMTVDDCIKAYRKAVTIPASDDGLLDTLAKTHRGVSLSSCTNAWADEWIATMKGADKLSAEA